MSGKHGERRYDYSCKERVGMMTVKAADGFRGGYIVTPHGIVGFYDQVDKDYTTLDVVFHGRCYVTSWDRKFTDRRLKTLARRFAAEVAAERAQ